MHFLNKLLITFVFTLTYSTFSTANTAAVPDEQQPINIQADSLNASEREGKSVYKGNVVVTQGSLTLKGDQIEVIHPKGSLSKAITKGNPATFKRYNTEEKSWVNGKASTIEYNTQSKTVLLIGNAEVEQPGKHVITGPKLFYDMQKQTLSAESTPQEKKRVSVTFTPDSSKQK